MNKSKIALSLITASVFVACQSSEEEPITNNSKNEKKTTLVYKTEFGPVEEIALTMTDDFTYQWVNTTGSEVVVYAEAQTKCNSRQGIFVALQVDPSGSLSEDSFKKVGWFFTRSLDGSMRIERHRSTIHLPDGGAFRFRIAEDTDESCYEIEDHFFVKDGTSTYQTKRIVAEAITSETE